MRPPAPLNARWIFPRCFVCASRISQVFAFERIKSNQGFFTTSNIFVDCRREPLLPANFFLCPIVALPRLPGTPAPPLLPLLPCTPVAPLLSLLPWTPAPPRLPWTPAPPRLPLLPGTPAPPQLPWTPPPPRNAFRFELAHEAFFLKQAVQNFARGEAASFRHLGLLHFFFAFFAMAAAVKLKTSTSHLNMNGNGAIYVHNHILG